ncbi:MAG: hypothetical protein HZC54_12090 [Verrucomicrobia bacterium]|nr:hypothetical protein [Verrucomicrobiota bacterium]
MPYDPSFPPSHGNLTSDAFRANFNGLHDETASVLSDVTTGAIPKKTGDGTLGDSALSEGASQVILNGKLLSLRCADTADSILLEVHNGNEPVLHIRINNDGTRIAFNSNRSGFSFQSPLDVNGAPVAMKPMSLAPLGLTVSDPASSSEVQSIADKLDEFINLMKI